MKPFTLTEDHMELLRVANISWLNFGTGAPGIDPKRPYGNSDWEGDIARILDWEVFEDHEGEKHLSKEQYKLAERLHRELEEALQVFLLHAEIELGTFARTEPYNCRSYQRRV